MIAHELVQVRAADLLLTLENKLDVHRQSARLLHDCLDRLEVHEDLALVVCSATGVNLAFPDRRLKRRRLPEVEWIDRLHVVVPVKENSRRARCAKPVAIDHRVAGCLNQPHVLEPDPAQLFSGPF